MSNNFSRKLRTSHRKRYSAQIDLTSSADVSDRVASSGGTETRKPRASQVRAAAKTRDSVTGYPAKRSRRKHHQASGGQGGLSPRDTSGDAFANVAKRQAFNAKVSIASADGNLRTLKDIEDEVIRLALSRCQSTSQLARSLGIGRSTLYRKLADLGLIEPAI